VKTQQGRQVYHPQTEQCWFVSTPEVTSVKKKYQKVLQLESLQSLIASSPSK
jgi:hypothetical protein